MDINETEMLRMLEQTNELDESRRADILDSLFFRTITLQIQESEDW